MKVVVLSDLHIDDNSDWTISLNETLKRIKNITKKNEKIIFILLGDIVNGFWKRTTEDIKRFYKKADNFIYNINEGLIDNNVEFYFIPGNHDLDGESLESFNEFIERHSRINEAKYEYTLDESVFIFDIEDFRFILVDSNLSRDYNASGKIDGELLKTKGATDKQIILFMHHPPSTRESYSDYDDKALDNPLDIMFLHAKYVFYGHQHGDHKEDLYKNHNTIYIPVSGLFNKGENIKNGFTVLDIQESSIVNCCQYEFDGVKFHKFMISPDKTERRFDELLIETHDYREELQGIIPRHYYQFDSFKETLTLEDIIRENDFVIITGEPGIGKTYEAHRLYQQYIFDDEYYPILIDLRYTTLEAINRYVEYACKYRIENKDVLLIVDGLSESTSSIFNEFLSKLINLPDGNQCIKAVITKRDNYVLKFLSSSYQTFHIKEFDNEDITTYLTMRKVNDISRFMNGILSSDYGNVIGIPFILNAVTDIYIKEGSIPKFKNLMQRIIALQFMDADNNLSNKYQIMPVEYDVKISLEELGFVMQAICEHPLDNIHYSQLFDEKIQSLQSYTGLLYRDCNYRRDYIHEIFAEYFISGYICNLELSNILEIITYSFQNKTKIKRIWYDVVRRIIDMRQNDDLLDWIIKNDNHFFIYNVPEKMMHNTESVHIVKFVLNNCFSKNLPIHTVISDIERFVNLHSSEAMWELIIKELFNPHSEYGLSTILQIVRCAKSTDIDLNRVQEKLIEIITDEQPTYIKSLALSTLMKLNERVDEYIDKIIDFFSNETDMNILLSIFTIIQNSSNPDNYFEYAINRFENVDRPYIYLRFDETFLNVIASIQSTEVMVESIKYMCKSEAFDRIYNTSRVFELVVDKITECVIKEHKEESVFNQMYDCFILASHQIDGRKTELIKRFFAEVDKLEEVLYRIIIDNTLNFYSSFESLIDSDLMDKLIEYYHEDVFTDQKFEWYINRYSVPETDRDKLKEAYKTKHGKDIQLVERSAWAINHEAGEREYFNSLFDKDIFNSKISELVNQIGDDILIAEFFEKCFSVIPDDRQDLQMIGGLIHRIVGDSNIHFTEFLSQYKWNSFQYCAILEFIKSKDMIILDDKQREFLLNKYNHILENTNFENASFESYDSMDLRFVVALISKYDFECDDEKLLEMLMLPWHIFASSTESGSSEVLKFIKKHIKDQNKLHNRIIYNLENKSLNIFAKETHIFYCYENQLSNAISSAVDLFKSNDKDAEYRKHIAIQYLLQFKGEEFVDSLISNDTEDTVLEYLATCLIEHNQVLVKEMITRNQSNDDCFLFIRELVILNNSYGLRRYVDFVKDKLTIPELYDKTYSNIDITMQLRKLSDDSLINEIIELFITAYSEGFRDKEDVRGLKGNLDNAITKMCRKYPDEMKSQMNEVLSMCEEHSNEELVFRCNYYISICDDALSTSDENTWTFEQAYKYVCDRRKNKD